MQTPICELLDVEVPIIQAAIWPATSAELVAAVGDAGAIGSIGAVFESAADLQAQIKRVRELTQRPFIVNHVVTQLDSDAFEATLAAQPKAISFALGSPAGLIDRVHEAGALAIHQVHTVGQARAAAESGVDIIIAQGMEAGGQGMVSGVGALALIPQVVDAVDPIPVLAAGGIADGRGLAAALVAGAAGANIGTRFLATEEAAADEVWKQRIVEAEADEVVRFESWAEAFPAEQSGAYPVVPRVLQTEFVQRWSSPGANPGQHADEFRAAIGEAVQSRRTDSLVPFTGQTAGLVREILPAGEVVRRMAAEARSAIDAVAAP